MGLMVIIVKIAITKNESIFMINDFWLSKNRNILDNNTCSCLIMSFEYFIKKKEIASQSILRRKQNSKL
jgi:hypothetical protein